MLKPCLISSHHTCLNMKKGSEGHRAAKIIFYLISPSNLPIRSATITGCSISLKNKMLKFHFKLLQGDDVPIRMLTICARSCDVNIFFSIWNLTGMCRLVLFLYRAGKGWREEVCGGEARREEGVSEWMLPFLLRRLDIIKDSPCVLPLLSSKGMLAPGSSVLYYVPLAEKRLHKWL